jgi:predicted GIY-YIG superfamily endonuclease
VSDEFSEQRRAYEHWERHRPDQIAALEKVAAEWLADNPPPASYSTGQNTFLWLAEKAYFDARDRWIEANPARLPPPAPPRKGFHLYRLWAADGRLLYVGVSTRLAARLRSHKRRHGDLIDHVTWEEHSDAAAMLAAEREAIREENPALNKAGIG